MSSLQDQLDQFLAEFEQTQKAMERAQSRLMGSQHTTRSKNRMVSATVDSKGDVTKLDFHTTAYRGMAPAELGELLTGVIREARAEAQAEVQRSFGGLLPDGDMLSELATGKPMSKESIFQELERVFSWGRRPEAKAPPGGGPDDGWTGDRKSAG